MKLGRFALIGVVVFALAATGTSAVGYFTAAGGGIGTATVGELAAAETVEIQGPPPIGADGIVQGALFPGGRGDVVLSIANPNAYTIAIVRVSQGPGPVLSSVATCGDFVTMPTPIVELTPAPELAAGETLLLPLPDAVRLSPLVPSICQGATFTVPLVVTVRR